MKQTFGGEDNRKIANSLTTVAAGMLTDIIVNILEEEHFEGTFKNDEISLFSINEYSFQQKCVFVIVVFLILWALLSYGLPIITYFFTSWIPVKKTKISTDTVLSTYQECRTELYFLVERVTQGNLLEIDYCLFFTDVCQLIVKFYNIFCSGKAENDLSVKDSFRTGGMVYDIGNKISSYEYLIIVDTLRRLVDLTYKKIKDCNSELLVFDYTEITSLLDKLSSLIGDLGIES